MIRPNREAIRFAIYVGGGVLSAVIDIGLMQAAILLGVGVYAATSLGFCMGLLFNYSFHAKVTFKKAMDSATFGRYLCVTALNYGLTLVFVAASLSLIGNALAGKIVSLPVIAAIGFWLGKRWIYR